MTEAENTSRRSLLIGGAMALSGCAPASKGTAAAAVVTQPRVMWRMASSFRSTMAAMHGAALRLSEQVARATDGRFTIRVHQADELVPALAVLDAVQKGAVEIGQTAGYYYTGKQPALAFETGLPFGLAPRQQQAWLHEGGGLELLRRRYADFGICNYPAGNTGVQMGGWFTRPINAVGELKGLKMRIPGMGGRVMHALGVLVQNIPGGDIFPALELGAIDATEWVGPFDDEKLGFYKVARFYHYPGWWEPGPELSFLVNQKALDALPSGYRAVLELAVRDAAAYMQQVYDAQNPPALERLRQHGVVLQPFPRDLMLAAREASEALLADEASQNADFAELLSHWQDFRRQSFAWFARAERAYADFSFE
jgi:TRAP-type mannitol/chloroaromatic compound transport system substrate-binding protein